MVSLKKTDQFDLLMQLHFFYVFYCSCVMISLKWMDLFDLLMQYVFAVTIVGPSEQDYSMTKFLLPECKNMFQETNKKMTMLEERSWNADMRGVFERVFRLLFGVRVFAFTCLIPFSFF